MMHVIVLAFWCALLQCGLTSGGFEMPFDCRGTNVTDRTRTDILDFINFIRARAALGQYKAYKIPSSNDMNKLKWDCNLETLAEAAVRNCPEYSSPSMSTNAINFNFFGPGMSEEILKNSIATAGWKWIEIAGEEWPAGNIYNGNAKLRSFANMIFANSTAVGCYSSTCERTASAACFFSQPGAQVGTMLFTSGDPCRNGDKCANSKPGVCENGLCVNVA